MAKAGENHAVIFLGRVTDTDLEQEPVELGFGQGKGALKLDGILGGQQYEGPWQGHGLTLGGDLEFLHCLEQGGLSPGSRPIYLVDEDNLGHNWSWPVLKVRRLLVVDEDYCQYGLSGELAAVVLEENIPLKYTRICTDSTIPYSRKLEDNLLPNKAKIVQAAIKLMNL